MRRVLRCDGLGAAGLEGKFDENMNETMQFSHRIGAAIFNIDSYHFLQMPFIPYRNPDISMQTRIVHHDSGTSLYCA